MANRMVAFAPTAALSRRRPVDTSSRDDALFNFQWSLQPMTTWMKIFGVPLTLKRPPAQPDEERRTCCWPLSIAMAAFYLLDIGCNTYVIVQGLSDVHKKNNTATINWNWMINEVNYFCLTTPSHTALLIVSCFAWKGLVQALYKLEENRPFRAEHYQQFRRICTVGSSCLFLEIVIELAESVENAVSVSGKVPLAKNLLSRLNMASLVYPYLGSILFCCLGWMASLMFRILAEEIVVSARAPAAAAVGALLDSWRRRYLLIVHLVHQMSRYFGFVLLVVITTEFVRMTSTSFFLLVDYQSNKWRVSTILMTFDFIKETTCFFILVYIPSRIRQQAGDLIKQLRQMNFEDHALQTQINFLTAEMIHSLPSVTAMGLVQVNLQLIPSLIGATLTYLIIFCQFQTSERANNNRTPS